MSNALEQFRAQRKAAEEVHATLEITAALLEQLRRQAAALSSDRELLAVLRAELAAGGPPDRCRGTLTARTRDAAVLAGNLATVGRRFVVRTGVRSRCGRGLCVDLGSLGSPRIGDPDLALCLVPLLHFDAVSTDFAR
jgi:hypothetical protein